MIHKREIVPELNRIMMYRLRRPVQIAVAMFLVAIPLVNFYGIKIQQRDDYAIESSWILSKIHSLFVGYDRDAVIELSHKIIGNVWTINIFGFKITDPLAVLESTATTFLLYLPLILSALIPVVLTIVLGKVFCGWICPMHLILEINDKIRGLLIKVGYNSRDIIFSKRTKYYVLIIGILAASFAGRPLMALIYPPAVISREIFYKIYTGMWGAGVTVIAIIVFVELVLSRRWWCRYICPGGALYTLLSRVRVLKVKRDDLSCDQCGDCIPICPYDLKPMTKLLNADCDQCGLCISVCKPGALRYTFPFPTAKSGSLLKTDEKNVRDFVMSSEAETDEKESVSTSNSAR